MMFSLVWSWVLFVCLIFLQGAFTKESEIFSSITELERLYKHEAEVVQKLQEYASVLDKNLHVIKKYIEDFNKIRAIEDDNDNAYQIVANPFTAFHILKRTVVDWEVVADTIKNHTKAGDIVGEVMQKSERMPTFEDFIGGSMALVGLQDTYGLNLSEIIHGNLGSDAVANTNVPQSPYELSARDLLFLGKAAFNKGLYDRSIMWLEQALSLAESEAQNEVLLHPSVTREEILPYLETTRRVHDEVLEKRGPFGETWQTFPKPVSDKLAKKKKYSSLEAYKPKIYTPINPKEENENYKALCRGEYLRNPKLDAKLRCRLVSRPQTRSVIGPFKIEEHSLDPYIFTVEDVMTEKEMTSFRETASSRLKRSLHQGRDGHYVATDIRTSKQAWLTKDDGQFVNKVSQRISDVTGLRIFPENEASELFQVANYGMAGRYTPHTDYITGEDHIRSPIEQLRGNRIATFMVYLEDVAAGGSTVFPLVGVQVKPKKGMGVFWWNLKRDGYGDPLTRHAGCSVLYGNKWIANKWIRYNYQFQKALCLPEPENDRDDSFGLIL